MKRENKNMNDKNNANYETNFSVEEQSFSDLANQFTNFMIFLSCNGSKLKEYEKFIQTKSLKTQH